MAGNMMEYDFKSHPFVKLTQAAQPEELFRQFQGMMVAGKAMEAAAVSNARQMMDQSYQQTFKILEEMDRKFYQQKEEQPSLHFPFDVLDQMTRQAHEQWNRVTGVSGQEQKQAEEALKAQLAEMEKLLSERDDTLEIALADIDKAVKAKATAQRNARKVKTEREEFEAQCKTLHEDIKTKDASLAEVQQENNQLKTKQVDLEKRLEILNAELATLKVKQAQNAGA